MNAVKKEKTLFVLIVIAGIIGYIWIRLEVVNLGFEHQKYIKQKRELSERNKQLTLEYANVLSPSKIEANARENLGLIEPTEKQIRYIK